MNFLKKSIYTLLVLTLTLACSEDDSITESTVTIKDVTFTTSIENVKGNEIGITPTSEGGTSYLVDFGDAAAQEVSDGTKVNHIYPETDATYTITVTASATNATDVSIIQDVTVDYAEDVVEKFITDVAFTTSVANSKGNKIDVTPTSVGGTSYSVDFGDDTAVNDADIIISSGGAVSYTYPETDATYTITVTASASEATDVSVEQEIVIDYTDVVIGTPFDITSTIDFEDGGYGASWSWNIFENDDNPALEFVANPDASGVNRSTTVAKITARQTGAPWVGTENVHGEMGITWDLNSSNAIIKIMVYKTVISNVGIKTVNPAGGAQGQILVANTKINEWEELTFDFSSRIGNGLDGSTNIDQIVVFPDFNESGRSSDTVTYFDNITFTAVP